MFSKRNPTQVDQPSKEPVKRRKLAIESDIEDEQEDPMDSEDTRRPKSVVGKPVLDTDDKDDDGPLIKESVTSLAAVHKLRAVVREKADQGK